MTQQSAAGLIPRWTVGDRLRKARETAGLSQDELAAATGVSRRSISTYESATEAPKRPVLVSISLATGVPVAWLIGDTPPRGGGERARRYSKPQPSDPKVVVTAFGRTKKVASVLPAAAAA